jgi:hypothetical protein
MVRARPAVPGTFGRAPLSGPTNAGYLTTDMQPRTTPPSVTLRGPATTPTVLSALCAVLMAVAAVGGIFASDLYHESDWAAGALRGGDLVTLSSSYRRSRSPSGEPATARPAPG